MSTKRRKDPAAVRLGRRGGLARKKALTATQRTAIARLAAQARWAEQKAGRHAG
ncbi:MAG: hypothetical protein IT159_08245 [Bryobacterales bacterium]|nr:hypothetical protein [Bryobacterales bacterium]